jgi:hypothetical protein
MWQGNLNPFSLDEVEEWCSYSEDDSRVIEQAYINRERFAYLANYSIDMKQRLQILNKDPTKRRPVRREENNKGNKKLKKRFNVRISPVNQAGIKLKRFSSIRIFQSRGFSVQKHLVEVPSEPCTKGSTVKPRKSLTKSQKRNCLQKL